jgi:hypothetical protein
MSELTVALHFGRVNCEALRCEALRCEALRCCQFTGSQTGSTDQYDGFSILSS